jgi:hypothetical protein
MAQRMNATTIEVDSGHLSLITHPHMIAKLILQAASPAAAVVDQAPATLGPSAHCALTAGQSGRISA